eukprot:scaffold495_cov243-Pinguiococcus_pyrenoidosus.AAC.7
MKGACRTFIGQILPGIVLSRQKRYPSLVVSVAAFPPISSTEWRRDLSHSLRAQLSEALQQPTCTADRPPEHCSGWKGTSSA